MSGGNFSYNRFDEFEKQLEEASCYQKGGEVKCPECDGEGCDHCDEKGSHSKKAKKGEKPDYLDVDKDGDKEEAMKDALKEESAKRGEGYTKAISNLKKKIGHKDADPKRGAGYTKAVDELKKKIGHKAADPKRGAGYTKAVDELKKTLGHEEVRKESAVDFYADALTRNLNSNAMGEAYKPTPFEKMERQSGKAYKKEQDAVRRGDEDEANKQMKRRASMASPLGRRTELINQGKGPANEKTRKGKLTKESLEATGLFTEEEIETILEGIDVMEVYKGKHGQSDKEYADSRSEGGKMISGDSKQSGAEYTHGRRVKAANPGMQPDVGGKTKPKSQGKMDKGTRADLEYRKANLKKDGKNVYEALAKAYSEMYSAEDIQERYDDMPAGDVGHEIHKKAVKANQSAVDAAKKPKSKNKPKSKKGSPNMGGHPSLAASYADSRKKAQSEWPGYPKLKKEDLETNQEELEEGLFGKKMSSEDKRAKDAKELERLVKHASNPLSDINTSTNLRKKMKEELEETGLFSESEIEALVERNAEVEAQGKKIAGLEKEGRAKGLTDKFRQEHPGSREEKKERGAKKSEGDVQADQREFRNKLQGKYGRTEKQKKEASIMSKHTSPRD